MPATGTLQSLDSLLFTELRDLYSAEKQLTKALPKMADAASHSDLEAAFNEHLEETKEHVKRLEEVFEEVGRQPEADHCEAMEGLIEEGEEVIHQDGEKVVKDAALIATAQRAEHYEISGYGSAATYADELGLTKARDLLHDTLEEEKAADTKLNTIATGGWLSSGINREAQQRSR